VLAHFPKAGGGFKSWGLCVFEYHYILPRWVFFSSPTRHMGFNNYFECVDSVPCLGDGCGHVFSMKVLVVGLGAILLPHTDLCTQDLSHQEGYDCETSCNRLAN